MFAVLKTGGKQYKVKAGDILRVEKLAADAGDKVQFNEVLMLGGDKTVVGAPFVTGAGVQADVIDQIKGDKLIKFVKRRRKHGSKRTVGHRQKLTLVKITDIVATGADKSGLKAALGAGSAPSDVADVPAPTKGSAPKKKVPKVAAEAIASPDDLTAITGIGPAAAKKLAGAGVSSFAELAAIDVDNFDAVKVKPEWVDQAKELAK